MEDRSFKKMLDEREADKARGPPASSHFAKMQNSTIWGVKPNIMGEDKDWVMPKEIPKAKTDDDSKSTEVKKTDMTEATEIGQGNKTKMQSPLEGEGNLTGRTLKSAGEMPTFKDIMAFKKNKTIGDIMYYPGYDPDYTPTLPSAPVETKQTTLDDGPNSFFGQDNYIENELTRRTDLDNDVTDEELMADKELQGIEDRKSLVDSTLSERASKPLPGGSANKWQRRLPHGYESSASNKNSKYKNIDRRTERKS